jgi:RNA polymerase sigma-70 factor (ECF subfamily)
VSTDGEPNLITMCEAGRHAWPEVALERRIFEQYVVERGPSPGDWLSLRPADLYLACACAQRDPRALAEFENHYLCEVPAFLARSNATARFIDDVRQQLRERLFVEGKITQYSGRGALTSWLRVVTVRAASNLRRQDRPHADIDEVVLGTAIDPELDVIRRRYGDTFRTALRDAIAGLDMDDRNLIRLHYIDGLNIERIAVVFRVSRATIGRRMIAVRERILAETNRLLRERLNATPSELDSLLRVVRSQLGMSLSDALREP